MIEEFKCKECDFKAKSAAGLSAHSRSKHKTEDADLVKVEIKECKEEIKETPRTGKALLIQMFHELWKAEGDSRARAAARKAMDSYGKNGLSVKQILQVLVSDGDIKRCAPAGAVVHKFLGSIGTI